MNDDLFDLHATHNPHRWYLPITESVCVGPKGGAFMFGGVGLAASVRALERTSGRPLIWATSQYLSYARPPQIVDLDVHIPVNGKQTTQARVIAHVGDQEIVTVLAALFLGETMRWRRSLAVVVGFGGVLLMVRPDGDGFFGDGRFVGSLLALFSTVTYAIVLIVIRRLSTTESSITIAFWFTMTGLVASGLVLPFEYVAPVSLFDAGLFIAMGVLGGVAQILMTAAYRWGPASIVAHSVAGMIRGRRSVGMIRSVELSAPYTVKVMPCRRKKRSSRRWRSARSSSASEATRRARAA
jgi:hypothetical protein